MKNWLSVWSSLSLSSSFVRSQLDWKTCLSLFRTAKSDKKFKIWFSSVKAALHENFTLQSASDFDHSMRLWVLSIWCSQVRNCTEQQLMSYEQLSKTEKGSEQTGMMPAEKVVTCCWLVLPRLPWRTPTLVILITTLLLTWHDGKDHKVFNDSRTRCTVTR